MTSRILLIEDETPRVAQAHRWFNALGYTVVWAATPDQIRYYLRRGPWALTCWDNDLGFKDQDGASFARSEFGSDAVACSDAIWIWSHNTAQALMIEAALRAHVDELARDTNIRYPIIHRSPFGAELPGTIQIALIGVRP